MPSVLTTALTEPPVGPWDHGWICLAIASGIALALWLLHRCRLARAEARFVERERDARDLNDGLLQGLQGLVLSFDAASQGLAAGDGSRAAIEAALRRADLLLRDGRERALLPRLPAGAAADPLLRALAGVGTGLSRDYGAAFRLQLHRSPRALTAEVDLESRAILGEALLNAFRHADAGTVTLALRHGHRRFVAEVRDDGKGFVPESGGSPAARGLAGMRERAGCIGATLAILSRPGRGTRVVLVVPASQAYASAGR